MHRIVHQNATVRAFPRRSHRILCSTTKTSNIAKLPLHVGIGAGGFAGLISALTGVGGGIILIPALAKFTTLSQQAVNGTSIGAVTVSTAVGAMNHMESGACNLPLALLTTLPSIVSARYGVQAAHRMSSKRLSLVVGSAMLLCAPLILLKGTDYLPQWSQQTNSLDIQCYTEEYIVDSKQKKAEVPYIERIQADPHGFVMANAKYVVAGCLAGFLSGLCGLGGGILMTAYLTSSTEMPQEFIIGTSLVSIVPTAASSTYFNIKANSIHLPTAVRVGGSLALSVYLTSKYVTHQVPEEVLRGILVTTLGTAALIMIKRAV